MKWIKKWLLFGWLLSPRQMGVPCWVMGKEANRLAVVPGRIVINVDQAVDIRYLWLDNTAHAFVADQKDFVGEIDGIPLFLHNVGELFPPGKDVGVGSELWYKILVSSADIKIATAYEDYRDRQRSFPWKMMLILGGAAIAIIYLWQSGFIDQFLRGIVNQ